VRLLFAGTPDTAVPSLRALIASGRRMVASPVKEMAQEHGIPVFTPAHPREPEFIATLRELAPEACPVVAYGALLPQEVLDIPEHGWVNLHFSLLPAWRGAAPVQRALMAGDTVTGASTFRIEAGLDTGPVFGTMTEAIRSTDTAGDLLGRLAAAGAGLLVATLDGIEDGTLAARPQSHDGVSHAPKLTVAEAQVRWDHPAFAVDRLVRGCTPDPGAWTTFRGQRVALGPVSLFTHDAPSLPPGRLLADKKSVVVGTATGPVLLSTVRPQGKKEMAAADWARGVRIDVGEDLGG
jgi:methionyl-tRNA formyltransferase